MTTLLASHITVADAAKALAVSERTVWRYLKSGRLASETTGPAGERRTLIARSALDALVSDRGRDPEAEALRAERDRLAAELAVAQAARAALESRVSMLQRAVASPARSGLVWRTLARAKRFRPGRLSSARVSRAPRG